MKDVAPFLIWGVSIPLAVLLIRYKLRWSREFAVKRLAEEGVTAEVVGGGWMPPLRLWWRNRKGDARVKLRLTDGSI